MRLARRVVAVAVVATLGAACGGGEPEIEPVGIRTEAPPERPVIEDPMVAFEVRLLCDLQRRTFENPEAITAYRTELLAGAGITEEDYEAFRRTATDEQRDQVAAALVAACT